MFLSSSSVLVFGIIIAGVISVEVILTPKTVDVKENESVVLTVSYTGTYALRGCRKNNETWSLIVLFENGTCVAVGFLQNRSQYTLNCLGNKSFSITIIKVEKEQHGDIWQCRANLSTLSNNVTIKVQVPVRNVRITTNDSTIILKESEYNSLTCITSYSRPKPSVKWFIKVAEKTLHLNSTETDTLYKDEKGFESAKNVLDVSFNRDKNGAELICSGGNGIGEVQSNHVVMNITFPPSTPALRYIDSISNVTVTNSEIKVIQADVFTVSCNSVGNPPPEYRWESGESGNKLDITAGTSVNKTCTATNSFGENRKSASSTVFLYVQYSPTMPQITILYKDTTTKGNVSEYIRVIEKESLNLSCTSKGNPLPTYKWHGHSGELSSNKELVRMNVSRHHRGLYTCTASNTMIRTFGQAKKGSNIRNITVDVLFPPSTPSLRYIDSISNVTVTNSEIKVIQADVFTVSCHSVGNPSPEYSWKNGETGDTLDITAKKSFNKNCTATNTMTETVGLTRNGSASSTISVNVQYSPTMPNIYIHLDTTIQKNVSDYIRVIEKESLNLSCTSKGNPLPTYKWHGHSGELSSNKELERMNISRHHRGLYTCTASNTMIRTFGQAKKGSSIRNITVDVLYPAEVGDLQDITKLEGSSINVTCPVILGNPPEAAVKWTPGGDLGSAESTRLYISNISRNDEKTYNCSVTTLMIPTYVLQKEQINYGQFQLTVNYKARVTEFYIGEETKKDVYTVNETENVTFTCIIDSKPAPTATILFNNSEIHRFKNEYTYRRENITCTDFGLYQCTGINKYNNGSQSVMNLTLYVNCSPRPSPIIELKLNVTSARNTMATFSFTALAYPEPGPAGFIWSFMNGSDRITISNISNIFVLNTNFQSNLVIRNVTLESYGQYRLRINNTMGVFEQSFHLKPLDVPMVPAVSNWTSGVAHITIGVTAGFNGGLPQWFYLKYKKLPEGDWIREPIVNTSSEEFNYTVDGLSSGQSYQFMLFAGNIKGNSTHVFITVKTKENAAGQDNSSFTTAVAGSTSVVAAVIVVIIIAGLLYRKRRHDKNTGKSLYQNIPFTGNIQKKIKKYEASRVEETPFEGLQEIDDVPKVSHEPVEYYNSQDVLETIDRIKVSELFSYLKGKDEDSFGIDYQKLPTGLEKPCTFARKPEHLAKNRYNGIYPYDHSRVKLHGDPDFFINACYIDGYKRTKAYIASLGPTAKTTSDFKTFWQMIWHEQSDIIVMLTNLREPSGMKCEKYWPDHGHSECYGDITVTGQNIEVFAEYTVRIFSVLKDDESRTVAHLHYTAWPDKKVPEDTVSLLEFRQRIKTTPTLSEGPVVVHCSAGIGRTGTLIALDRLIEEGQCEGSVNVYECVLSMREQRVKMVQTLEQYVYIYKALVGAIIFDSEIIPLESYEEYMETTTNTTLSYQFKQLKESVDTESKEELESRILNGARTTKNRLGADIPAAHSRVFLYLNKEADDSDYINAVYMNSFKRKNNFIIAQSPLSNTVTDFICMLYQEDCTCIVSMEDMKEPGTSVGVYLPTDGQKLKSGHFIVSCTKLEMNHHCVVRKVIIKLNGKNENGEKTLYHFQYTNWMLDHDCPMNANEFVQFVTEVEEYANQFCEERSHVLVHCLKANERSGLFCAVTTLIEKLKYERQVNVLNTLRHIRTRRKTSITSMEQLKFCYQTGSVYIKMFRP